MREERDDLAMRLAEYKVRGADEALLDRIVAAAAATPQHAQQPVWSWRALMPQLAALAAMAVLGFWGGNLSAVSGTSPVKISASVVSLNLSTQTDTDKDYLSETIFGETSWKEINL